MPDLNLASSGVVEVQDTDFVVLTSGAVALTSGVVALTSDFTVTTSGVVAGDVVLEIGKFYKAVDKASGALAISPATFVLPERSSTYVVKTEFSTDTATTTLIVFEGHEKDDGTFVWSSPTATAFAELDPDSTDLITEAGYQHGEVKTLTVLSSKKFRIAHTAPSAGSFSLWIKPL